MQSDNISELAKALTNFQSKLEGVKKDSTVNHFKHKYADLASVWEAVRGPLTECGLSVTQLVNGIGRPEGFTTTLITTLFHESGEWISGEMPLILAKLDPQGQGSAISYARRYALAAILGVYQVDDDAQEATDKIRGQGSSAPAKQQAKQAPAKQAPPAKEPEPIPQEDWDLLSNIANKNHWPQAYRNEWFKDKKRRGWPEAKIYAEAMIQFSRENTMEDDFTDPETGEVKSTDLVGTVDK